MRSGPRRLTAPRVRVERPYDAPDESDVSQRVALELAADPHVRPPRSERLAEHLEDRGALLERLEETLARLELVGPDLAEQARGSADEEALVLLACELGEGRPQELEELPLARRERRVLEPPPHDSGPELEPGKLLVQVLAGPQRKPGVDRLRQARRGASTPRRSR